MKHTYLAPVFTVLAAGLLQSCGTTLCNAPYCVGVKAPQLAGKSHKISDLAKATASQDIYRIGSGFYSKVEVNYYPMKPNGYTWDCIRGAKGISLDTTAAPEHATYYCRLTAQECVDNQLEMLPPNKAEAAVLTAEAAAKLNPTYATSLQDAAIPESCKELLAEKRFSNSHYYMLPATGIVFVGVDLPCTILGSLWFGIQSTCFGL